MRASWVGLVGGILTLVLAVASWSVPWWQVTAGKNLVAVDLSPVRLSVNLLGVWLMFPIIFAINIIFLLLLIAAGIALIAYSVVPTKPYSRHLLGFGYKKPLLIFVGFTVLLLLLTNVGTLMSAISGNHGLSSMNIPLSGATTITMSNSSTQSATVSTLISANLGWTFWLAMATAILCVATRIYHGRLS